ncbi:MAG: hypothetical protein M1831_002650 [Alyxoria varia]|nr:MAG: hypothetical protein M1831_002650 [Alyxoria varia]
MSRYFPHSEYAEDQRLATTILQTHVMHRGFQTGATMGILTGAARAGILGYKAGELVPQGATVTTKAPLRPTATIVRSTGIGGLIGLAAVTAMMPFYMHGREEIEWQDKSWRLQQNLGQLEVDDWSILGTSVGAATIFLNVAPMGGAGSPTFIKTAGGAGVGSVASVFGYMLWRYGIRGGKR